MTREEKLLIDIINYRRENKMSQMELAKKCNITHVTVSNIERRKHKVTKRTEAMIRAVIGGDIDEPAKDDDRVSCKA